MRNTWLSLVLLSATSHFVTAQSTGSQIPLSVQRNHFDDLLSMMHESGLSTVETISDFALTALSENERKDLMVRLWEQHDVVDVMTMTGHGDGLDERRLIQIFGEDKTTLVTEGQKLRLKKAGVEFMDITDNQDLGKINAQSNFAQKTRPVSLTLDDAGKASMKATMKDLSEEHLRADITKLSSFWNRSYRSNWGLLSSNWIHDQAEALLKSMDKKAVSTSIKKFAHKFPQNSIIARIETAEKSSKDKEIIIVSAHQDSLNYALPFYRAPGADDDGSGSVTILQVLRSLSEQNFVPPSNVAVEFHWFAAEEGGLLGSQDVASSYEKAGKTVRGVLHMDMTAFVKNGTDPIIAFFDTNVDKNLTTFATKLVDEYIPLGWNMTRCGNSCGSDHMSFTKAGFPAVFATESLFEDFPLSAIHTVADDMEQDGQYSFLHMLEFVKLGLAFVAELAVSS